METGPISGVAATSAESTGASRIRSKPLGQDDFFKLLVAQLTAQDPMNPVQGTEFIAQMAQFSALEESRVMQKNLQGMQGDLGNMRKDQLLLQANALIGRSVGLQLDDSNTVYGAVESVVIEAGMPKLIVDGLAYRLDQLIEVSPAPVVPVE